MKKTIVLLFAIIVFTASNMSAQKYSELKTQYDYRNYIPQAFDKYNPTVSGLCSFLVPGLGQIVTGEVGRGILFFGASTTCYIVANAGAMSLVNGNSSGGGTMLLGLGGMLIVDIWSIVDANHIAKVKNMHLQNNIKKNALSIQFSPYIEQLCINNQTTIPVGMTMKVSF